MSNEKTLTSDTKSENTQLRILLALLYSGSDLYRDDGELQDNRIRPFIDFKRDTVEEIKKAMQDRAGAAYLEVLKNG